MISYLFLKRASCQTLNSNSNFYYQNRHPKIHSKFIRIYKQSNIDNKNQYSIPQHQAFTLKLYARFNKKLSSIVFNTLLYQLRTV